MRIIHLTKKYPPALGGDAVYVAELEKVQRCGGHEVFVVVPDLEELRDKKGNISTFGLKDKSSNWDRVGFKRIVSLVMFFFTAFSILRRLKPSIIHAHAVDLGFIVSFAARSFRIPVVITCHSVLFPDPRWSPLKRGLDYFLLKAGGFKKIITVDSSSLDAFRAGKFRNYSFLPVGVDLGDFAGKSGASRPGGSAKIRFLFVGRLEKIKGLEVLLDAARRLRGERADFELIIAGAGSAEARLKRVSAEYGLDSCVTFTGAVYDRKELARIYLSADIFVLPSLREWCPIVIFEAWASGLAVIATRTGSVPDISGDNVNIVQVPPGDPSALLAAMRRLMEDEKTRAAIAGEGRKLVEKEFTWEIISEKLEGFYREAHG